MSETRDEVRERLVDVAADLLREQGRVGVTTRGVADRASVQAPTIYRLFGDKEGLLDAVAEHEMAVFAAVKANGSRAGEEVDPVEDLRRGWEMTVEFGLANPELYALVSDPARARNSAAIRAGVQLLAARVHRVARAGRLRVSEDHAVDLIHAAGTGAILATLAKPVADRDSTLADSMIQAVLAQLTTDGEALPEERSTVSHAVTLRAETPQLDALTESERLLLAEWLDRLIAQS